MIRETLPVPPLGCNCTILGEETSHEAIVVDPGGDIPRILALLAKHSLTVTQIFITHAHIDHIAAAATLKAITGAPILYHQLDIPLANMMEFQASLFGLAVPDVPAPDASLEDGLTITLGASHGETPGLTGTILHTPGHSAGSVCLYLPQENLLIAGDTLFTGSIGRTRPALRRRARHPPLHPHQNPHPPRLNRGHRRPRTVHHHRPGARHQPLPHITHHVQLSGPTHYFRAPLITVSS